jgi:hypothetical protein
VLLRPNPQILHILPFLLLPSKTTIINTHSLLVQYLPTKQPKKKKQQRHDPNPKVIPMPPPPKNSQDPGSFIPLLMQEPFREETPPQQPQIAPAPPSPQMLPPDSPIPPSALPSPHSPSHPNSLPEDEYLEKISKEESNLDTHASPIRKFGRKSNLHKREASAKKEIEIGKQTTLDQHARK